MEPSGGVHEERRLEKRGTLLEVNARIRDAASSFSGAETQAVWEFMCECGSDGCRALVRLTIGEYDSLKAADRPVVAGGHERSREARRAAALDEETAALAARAAQHGRSSV